MKITVTTVTDYVFELDVHEDLELENFKAFCEVESGFPSTEIVITFKGQQLSDDKKSLKDYGMTDGDVVLLAHALQAANLLSSAANRSAARSGGSNRKLFENFTLNAMLIINITNFVWDLALAGLDFSAIQVPNSPSGGSLSSSAGLPQSPISIGMNDDPAMVREAFFKNPDQLALVSVMEHLEK